jgi:glutamate N-acetyltransferase/amino-acid N-acetyltransferase
VHNVPKGFVFSVQQAGFRKEGRPDLALVVSDRPCVTAATFTQNAFAAAPVTVARQMLAANRLTRAVVINSGQANACTGETGLINCQTTLQLVAQHTGLAPKEILPASTGVIGSQLHMEKWKEAVPLMAENLGKYSLEDFAKAIMTTDAFPKIAGREARLSAGVVTVAGVAKGGGMICPDMATMLCVLLCDAAVALDDWTELFSRAVTATFNRVSVDGDTSTNDTAYGLANGASGVQANSRTDLELLGQAVEEVLGDLAYMLVKDGEGASKVAHITVSGACDAANAELVARTVGHSPLVKTALYGRDANWGRVVMAIGHSGARFNPQDVRVSICDIEVFAHGQAAQGDFDSALTSALAQHDININITLGNGPGGYILLASDLGQGYIDCNASYRS